MHPETAEAGNAVGEVDLVGRGEVGTRSEGRMAATMRSVMAEVTAAKGAGLR